MACYYYLRLPAGGELRIPASFSNLSLSNSAALRGLIDNYKSNKKDSESDLRSYITNNTPLDAKSLEIILKEIPKDNAKISTQDLGTFITSVNDGIDDQGEYHGLITMLKNSVFKGNAIETFEDDNWKPIEIDKLIKALSKPIYANYFADIDADAILGGNSFIETADQMKFKTIQLDSIGLNTEIYTHFQTMMDYAFPNKAGVRTSKNFFQTRFRSKSYMGTDDSVVIYDENLNSPIIFYNEASDLSLHFAIFKILGTTLLEGKQAELSNLITEYNIVAGEGSKITPNLTAKEFFHGVIDESGNRKDPEFYTLLKYKYGEKSLQHLAFLMTEGLPEKEVKKLTKAFITVINFMNPDNLNKYNQVLESARMTKGIQNNQILQGEKLQILTIAPLSERDNRKYYYNISKQTEIFDSSNQMNNFLNANVRKRMDIVKVEIQDKLKKKSYRYIVPTYWRVLDEGIFIRGWYSNNGAIIKYEGKILKGQSITYSTLNSLTAPVLHMEDAWAKNEKPLVLKIDPNHPMPHSLLLNLIRRGTFIEYLDSKGTAQHGKVKNVFPGGIELNKVVKRSGDMFNPTPKLKDITEIQTNAEALEVLVPPEILKDETKIEDFLIGKSLEIVGKLEKWGKDVPISNNDWVSTKAGTSVSHNLVVGVSDDAVFVLVQSSKGSRIETIKKTDVVNIYKQKEDFDGELFLKVGAFYSDAVNENSIRKYNYSMFTDYEKTMRGDLIWSPSTKTLYKITNKETKELVKYFVKGARSFVEYSNEFPADGIFISDRNIAYDNYGLAIDFNNFNLQTKPISPTNVTRKYFVPINTQIIPEMLMASGNLTVGYIHFDNHVPTAEFRDATDEVVAMINKTRKGADVKNTALTISEIDGYIERYDANLYESKYSAAKNKYLQPYAYVTLKRIVQNKNGTEGITSSHKYRIITREESILLLEYNTYNQFGEVITVNKYLDLNKDEDKILNMYIMFDNKNVPPLKALDTKHSAVEAKISKAEQINNLIDTFQELYQIEVQPENNMEGKLKKKRAWIDTASGKNKIIINTDIKDSEQELVHEYLHLFLMAAKYNNEGVYEMLMTNYLKAKGESTQNINFEGENGVEERFVNEVNAEMWHNQDQLKNIDINSFLTLFEQIMKQLKVIEESDNTFSPEFGSFESVFSILNSKMSDIPAFTDASKKSKTNLLYYDANFKNWINELVNNQGIPGKDSLTINCE